ncbi:MoaD/ThiS family protein [Tenacibaculum sp. MEBiC06402]|uniref:MoaD/ThiS family protein n=1 Tax=unclassified Tenacibaculum TaxID=2635139 RepID=UPI003B9D2D3C
MEIKYFGEIAERTNTTSQNISLEKKSLFELLSFLKDTYGIDSNDIHIAVNHNLISKEIDLEFDSGDEIAILSPFAGG